MIIKPVHQHYLNNVAMIFFARALKIDLRGTDTDNLILSLNEFAEKSDENSQLIKNQLSLWIEEGRKKVLYRLFSSEEFSECHYTESLDRLNSIFQSKGLCFADIALPNLNRELWEIKHTTFNDKLATISFNFVQKIKQKQIDDTYVDISMPIIVTINFLDNEIYSKVESRSNLYKYEGKSCQDIELAKEAMDYVLEKLNHEIIIGADEKQILHNIIYQIQEEITELPEEVISLADSTDSLTIEFISKLANLISLLNQENTKEEMLYSIKNVIIKYIIQNHPDHSIFELGKFAISNGIDGAGKSMSNFRYQAESRAAVQRDPEYQDIKNIVQQVQKIKRSVLYWESGFSKNRIRMKMYAQKDGYILISFEQYVRGEDMENVFSKLEILRDNYKPTMIVDSLDSWLARIPNAYRKKLMPDFFSHDERLPISICVDLFRDLLKLNILRERYLIQCECEHTLEICESLQEVYEFIVRYNDDMETCNFCDNHLTLTTDNVIIIYELIAKPDNQEILKKKKKYTM